MLLCDCINEGGAFTNRKLIMNSAQNLNHLVAPREVILEVPAATERARIAVSLRSRRSGFGFFVFAFERGSLKSIPIGARAEHVACPNQCCCAHKEDR